MAPRKRRKKKKKPDLGAQLTKLLGSLTVLLLLVGLAGYLLHHMMMKPSRVDHTPQPPLVAKPSPAAPSGPPTFEIYPSPQLPPAPPIKRARPRIPGQVAIIVDDLGHDYRMADRFLSIKAPLAFSVLPFSPHGRRVVRSAQEKGREVLVHLPMEPDEYPAIDPGPGAILSRMTPDELIAQLRRNLDQIPEAIGVNNHMGSRLSTNENQLNQIFTVLKQRGLFYVDSRTTPETRAPSAARLLQLPFAQRSVFLDHDQNADAIRNQLARLVRIALAEGEAIGIAHPYTTTLRVLHEELPQLSPKVRLVPLSNLIHVIG